MRVLLDECIDVAFAGHIQGHDVDTVSGLGWSGTKNGELLRRAASGFDAFVTIDQNLRFQQNLSKSAPRVIILQPRSSRLSDLIALRASLQSALEHRTTEVVQISR